MIDFSAIKAISIPEGKVKAIHRESDGQLLWKGGYKNWVPYSTEADGKTIFNGGLGYKDNYRLNSSAAEVALSGYVVFGYIPVKADDVVRVKGITWDSSTNTGCYFYTFNSSFEKLKSTRPTGGSSDITAYVDENGVLVVEFAAYSKDVAYFRFSAYGSGAEVVITVNEEIT